MKIKTNHLKFAGIGALGLSILPTCKEVEKKQELPNIIYILADDLGYNELGCYGQRLIETPNIDALASQGVLFTNHYSGSPVSAPSRCVLLTGKHPGHAFIRGNDEMREKGDVWDFAKASHDPNLEGQRPIPDSEITIAELLKQRNYATACIGKWGLGGPGSEGDPIKQGFDLFYGYNCQRQAHTYFPLHLWKNDVKDTLDNELLIPRTKLPKGADIYDPASYDIFWDNDYSPDKMLDEALTFIDNNQDNPFFLYFSTPIPHVPLQAPDEWIQKYREKFGEEEPYVGDIGYFPHRYPKAAYAAMVSYLDDQIGQLVKKLKETGEYENTIIIFTSDNGPTYAGGADSPFFESAKPFKCEYGWGKGFLHEGGIRVPMIVSWPGHTPANHKTDHISSFYDVMPTLCDITNIELEGDVDGKSFLPAIEGNENPKHEYLYWEFAGYNGQQAVRMGDWKAIRKDIQKGNLEIELYNLTMDITEENNVADKHPDIVEEMEKIMLSEHEISDYFPLMAVDSVKLINE